jgi:gp16 family phage-associated protein
MPQLKTLEEARQTFTRTGTTIRQWAKEIGVHENTVYEVLAGRKRCLRGDAHKVAVLLGVKDGVISSGDTCDG